MSSIIAEHHNQIILSMLKKLACKMLNRTSDAAENILNWKDDAVVEVVASDEAYQDRYLEDEIYDRIWNDLYTEATLTFHLFDRAHVDISYYRLNKRAGALVIYDDGYSETDHTFVYPTKAGVAQVALDKNNQPL